MGRQDQTSGLADELLAAAASRTNATRGFAGWVARLSPEHRAAVESARDQWQAGGGTKGPITAKALSDSIREAMIRLGYRVPHTDGVTRWLTGRKN
jgi:hypothetical protein